MGSFEQFKGTGGVIDQTMEETGATNPCVQQKQTGYEEKTAAIHEEMKRMNRLPATSSYVTHRVRVLNKILQLLSIQNCFTRTGTGVALRWAVSMICLVYTMVDYHHDKVLTRGSLSVDGFFPECLQCVKYIT